MAVEVYQGLALSYERAISIAPAAYQRAYQWFLDHENECGPRPWRENTPNDVPITLVAQRGIHKPSGQRYAISVTVANSSLYGEDSIHQLDDNTWVIRYCEHHRCSGAKPGSPIYNKSLFSCLQDGIPVGVFYKLRSEYQCLGLAFLESYDTATGFFTLHGPVHKNSFDSLSPITSQEINAALKRAGITIAPNAFDNDLPTFDYPSTPNMTTIEIDSVRRDVQSTRQASFRRDLLAAYDYRCAISGYDTVPALTATYISSYLGAASNKPSAGILLRADLSTLYRQSLISINPETYEVAVGNCLRNSSYSHFDRRRIILPDCDAFKPSRSRLEAHHSAFMQINS